MRLSSCHHDTRPRCAHGCCFDFAKEPSRYCKYHAQEHAADGFKRPTYSEEMMRKMMSGRAARVRG